MSNPITLTFMNPINRVREQNGDSPAYVTDECDYMYRRSQLCRDLRAGFPTMIAKAAQYLPQYEGESDPDWEARVQLASLRNFYAQAVNSILGKMFAQPPKLNSDVPEAIVKDLRDADLNGNDWTVVAEELVNYALDEGVAWLVIDYHTVPEAGSREFTLAEEQAMGVRPYWVVVPQHRVLGVDATFHNNVYTVNQFRFATSVKKKDGRFGQKCVEQIRVIEPHQFTTFEKSEEGAEWVEQPATVNTLGMVAVIGLSFDKRGQFLAFPPLENLAYMNLEHFQIRSDQRRSLSVASFPILAQYGVDAKSGTVRIGPMTSIAFEDPNAKMQWVESQGVHLLAGDRELQRLESHMRTFGLSFENPGMYATATGRNIDASDSIAPIQRWAFRLRDCLNSALWYMAKWRKMAEGGTVNVNTSFLKNHITVEELKLLVEALKEGALTKESFLSRMQDYGLLSNDLDPQQEADALIKEAQQALADQMALEAAKKPPVAPGGGQQTQPDNTDTQPN